MSAQVQQAQSHGMGTAAKVRMAFRRDRYRAACHNARMDAATRHHLTPQAWQTATLPELLQMIEDAKTAPALQDVTR